MLEDFVSHAHNDGLMTRRGHNGIRECKLTIHFIALNSMHTVAAQAVQKSFKSSFENVKTFLPLKF